MKEDTSLNRATLGPVKSSSNSRLAGLFRSYSKFITKGGSNKRRELLTEVYCNDICAFKNMPEMTLLDNEGYKARIGF